MSERINPLPMVCPKFEHPWSDYPDRIRVSMEDGKVIDYRREIAQPSPVFKDQLDIFNKTCFGEYKHK